VNNRLPAKGDLHRDITLEHSGFIFDAPFGLDTLVLLTTAEQLPDPSILNFKGVLSGQGRGAIRTDKSPLERLLGSASAGMRGTRDDDLPTEWGVQYLQIQTNTGENDTPRFSSQ